MNDFCASIVYHDADKKKTPAATQGARRADKNPNSWKADIMPQRQIEEPTDAGAMAATGS